MTDLDRARNGETVTMPYTAIKDAFISLADLQAWCELFALQYTFIPDTNSYRITPIS